VILPRPFAAEKAVEIALASVGHGEYWLGTGDYNTPLDGRSDCAGFAICKCYGLRRHRPGFNKGKWASVEDDINCNSAIEDANRRKDLFVLAAPRPQPGDLLAYPTFFLTGHPKPWIGHIAIVVAVDRMAAWDAAKPDWSLLDVVQCCGPDGRKPGIVRSTAQHWREHDRQWPKPEHRSSLLRAVS